jgi:hypothetical protein
MVMVCPFSSLFPDVNNQMLLNFVRLEVAIIKKVLKFYHSLRYDVVSF